MSNNMGIMVTKFHEIVVEFQVVVTTLQTEE